MGSIATPGFFDDQIEDAKRDKIALREKFAKDFGDNGERFDLLFDAAVKAVAQDTEDEYDLAPANAGPAEAKAWAEKISKLRM